MRNVSLTVNDVPYELELDPRELLVYVLRERLGLTGTVVGCDTSSCGACTVLLDGESVKSCTVLGVQADGHAITTIEGLAENGSLHRAAGELPPAPRAPVRLLHERHGARRGEPARGEPEPERGRDPARARGQHLPLHGLSEHRRRDRGGGPMSAPAEVEVGRAIGAPVERKEDGKLLQGQAQWVDNMQRPGDGLSRRRAQPVRARAHHERERRACARARRRRRGVVRRRTSPTSGRARCPARGSRPRTRTRRSTSRVAIDKARYVGDAVAVIAATSRGAAEDAAELVEVEYEPLPAVVDAEAALADGAPLVHEEFGTNRVLHVDARGGRGRPAVRRGGRDGERSGIARTG